MTPAQEGAVLNVVLNMRSWVSNGEVYIDQVLPSLEMLEREFGLEEAPK